MDGSEMDCSATASWIDASVTGIADTSRLSATVSASACSTVSIARNVSVIATCDSNPVWPGTASG